MKSEVLEVKKIKALSVAKVFLFIGILAGLLYGAYFSVVVAGALEPSLASMSLAELQTTMSSAGYSDQQIMQMFVAIQLAKLGYWNLLVMPISLALLYSLGGIISALIYNLIARYTGGIKLVLR